VVVRKRALGEVGSSQVGDEDELGRRIWEYRRPENGGAYKSVSLQPRAFSRRTEGMSSGTTWPMS
jgi:hypothetical protein